MQLAPEVTHLVLAARPAWTALVAASHRRRSVVRPDLDLVLKVVDDLAVGVRQQGELGEVFDQPFGFPQELLCLLGLAASDGEPGAVDQYREVAGAAGQVIEHHCRGIDIAEDEIAVGHQPPHGPAGRVVLEERRDRRRQAPGGFASLGFGAFVRDDRGDRLSFEQGLEHHRRRLLLVGSCPERHRALHGIKPDGAQQNLCSQRVVGVDAPSEHRLAFPVRVGEHLGIQIGGHDRAPLDPQTRSGEKIGRRWQRLARHQRMIGTNGLVEHGRHLAPHHVNHLVATVGLVLLVIGDGVKRRPRCGGAIGIDFGWADELLDHELALTDPERHPRVGERIKPSVGAHHHVGVDVVDHPAVALDVTDPLA